MKDQERVGLYFGAAWRKFNAVLRDCYDNVAQVNNLEIVYVSADCSLLGLKDV